jgi:hypothetical protein
VDFEGADGGAGVVADQVLVDVGAGADVAWNGGRAFLEDAG